MPDIFSIAKRLISVPKIDATALYAHVLANLVSIGSSHRYRATQQNGLWPTKVLFLRHACDLLRVRYPAGITVSRPVAFSA